MSFYNLPKEHKLKKPKASFAKAKEKKFHDLYDGNTGKEIEPPIMLSEKINRRAEKTRNRKIWMQLAIVFTITIPLTFFLNHVFLNHIAANHKYRITRLRRNKVSPKFYIPFDTCVVRGYTNFYEKEFEKAIFYFRRVDEFYPATNEGILGLTATYDELCELGNIYYCDLLAEVMPRFKKTHYLRKEHQKKVLKQLRLWKVGRMKWLELQ